MTGERKQWARRAILGTGGLGLAGLGAYVYNAAPAFWKQYAREISRPIVDPPAVPGAAAWPNRGLQAAWLGHSTVLLKIDGFHILTDPVFSVRAGLNLGIMTLGVKRLVAPALAPSRLPHIDLILLSHAHMDHFDVPSLRTLEHPRTAVVTASRTGDLLRAGRYSGVHELGWEQAAQVGPMRVRAVEVNHWGARMRTDTYRGYNGFVIECGRYRVLFGGDTADTTKLYKVAGDRGVDLAVMPIGAYNPWIRYHCTPEQAWRMAQDARAEMFLPVHHSTFQLSREPIGEPLDRLHTAAGSNAGRIVVRRVGEEFRMS